MPTPKDKRYTAEEFFELEPETNERMELINGEIISQAAPSPAHQQIAGGIHSELRVYIKKKGGKCVPFISPLDVRIDDKNVLQPDVFVICDPKKIGDKRIEGAPDLVVEVLSSDRRYDLVQKFGIYENAGVREYWIIDPKNRRTLVYFFENDSFPNIYTFDQPIPVGIYGGELEITVGDAI